METSYGSSADGGAQLLKKFKRAVVQGGSLKGARYSDVSEADIRRGSKLYRGDQRFAQFCKQWVAATVVAPDEVLKVADASGVNGRKAEEPTFSSSWKSLGKCWIKNFHNWAVGQVKGRFFTSCLVVFIVLVIMGRPAFGKLCGKVIGLSVRIIIKRVFGILTLVLDSLLEEAASQVEQVLLPSPHAEYQHAVTMNQPMPQVGSSLQWTMHILCILVGSLLGRNLPRAIPTALNPGT